jgi:hypothetical protein
MEAAFHMLLQVGPRPALPCFMKPLPGPALAQVPIKLPTDFRDVGFYSILWENISCRTTCLVVHVAHALIDGGVHVETLGHEDLVRHVLFWRLVPLRLATSRHSRTPRG